MLQYIIECLRCFFVRDCVMECFVKKLKPVDRKIEKIHYKIRFPIIF